MRRRVPSGSERAIVIVQEAGWATEPVGTGAENLAPTGIRDPQTVQPVASRYTDYVNRPTKHYMKKLDIVTCNALSFTFKSS